MNGIIASCRQLPTCERNAFETVHAESLGSAGLLHDLWSRRYSSMGLFCGGFILSCLLDLKYMPDSLSYCIIQLMSTETLAKFKTQGIMTAVSVDGVIESEISLCAYFTVGPSFHTYLT